MKARCPTFAVAAKTGPAAPKLEATMMLDTKQSREKLADKSVSPSNAGTGPLGISRPAWMAEPFAAGPKIASAC